jgi:polysaccharide biosynthesis protein PslH
MRILWLGTGLLLPLDKGGKLRSWHLLRHLAARHAVTFLGFSDDSSTVRDLAGMREVCEDLHTVLRRDAPKGTPRFYLDAAGHVAARLPYAVGKYRSREYRARLETLLEQRWDALVCDFLVPAVNMPAAVDCPTVLFTHNVEAEIWRRHAETETRSLRRALLRAQWRRMRRFEEATLARFDTVLAVSEADRRTLRRLYGASLPAPIRVIPTGVDTAYFAPDPSVRPDPFRLAFTGSMDWLPNEDAALHFCAEIFPRLKREEPRVSLVIVGRNPTPAVRRLATSDASIQVTGRVDDVRPHVGRAALSIVPLRIGGGTRLKIYEAMAMGRAVVSTSIGAEGLPVTPGVHVSLADDPASFADEVLRLLRDERARDAMAEAGLRLVRERYDWSAVAGIFEHVIGTAAVGHAARQAAARVIGRAPAPAAPPATATPHVRAAGAPGRRVAS